MKKRLYSFVLALIFLAGASLFLYPTISNHWNAYRQSRLMAGYTEAVTELAQEDYSVIWNAADEYNRTLPGHTGAFYLTEEEKLVYDRLLNISGDGIMGGLVIPKIKVSLPICHGTSEEVLQIAVGHLEGSSLPVGGPDTHCVLSGHRGLPSAKLFTNLDQLIEGDRFYLRVLDQVLTYEVDQIKVVLPDELSPLLIEGGKDYCTLLTCTPYGINTHRLLVRGHRVENEPEEVFAVEAKTAKDTSWVIPAYAALFLLLAVLFLLITGKAKKKKQEREER